SCSDSVYRRAEMTGRPCLLGDIGKCVAPCVGRVTKDEHRTVAEDFVSFMAGNDTRYVHALEERMREAAQAQEYEAAARFRDNVQALRTVMEKTAIVLSDRVDADVFGIADDELAAAVQQFIVRGGRIRGVRSWVVDKELDVTRADLVEIVLQNAYEDDFVPPREVLVPELPEDAKELELWLAARRHEALDPATGRVLSVGRVSVKIPQRGEKAALAQTAELNAKNALMLYKTRRSADFVTRSQALTDIRDGLGMDQAPLRMECYDVSHLSGTNIVASMVVFEDGLPRTDQYRRFSIPSSTDDTESIYQVISRRLAYLRPQEEPTNGPAEGAGDDAGEGSAEERRKKFAYPPQLLIVDGGQPQVAAAARALKESGVTGIQLAGIAKRLEELWLPDSDYPVILPRNSDALFMIQRIRDEAHRFAITFQRARRKRDIASVLGEVPGLGPARVRGLLRHFGSVAQLKKADLAQIAEVKGIGAGLAATIHDSLHNQ
ncbi:MAG: excinuclease ABC subunit UvrC, partial [Microbacteriaceae bacterium]